MKTFLKIIRYVALAVVVLISVTVLYMLFILPSGAPLEDITIERTPERLERGEYLANAVTVCVDCHSTRDWTKYAGPIKPGSVGIGGEVFNREMGFPGVFYSKNITPYALSNWSDGEIFRAITSGINKEGEALFPVMDYHSFGQLDREDIYSIIAYLRTLEAKESSIPTREIDFPVNLLINTMPKAPIFSTRPAVTDQVAYGGYLITASGCVVCHSEKKNGAIVPGTEYTGGMEFVQPTGIVTAPNITFDKESGINFTKDEFIHRFKMYSDSSFVLPSVAKGELVTPMPWNNYTLMSEEDLGAIYEHLKSISPQTKHRERFKIN